MRRPQAVLQILCETGEMLEIQYFCRLLEDYGQAFQRFGIMIRRAFSLDTSEVSQDIVVASELMTSSRFPESMESICFVASKEN